MRDGFTSIKKVSATGFMVVTCPDSQPCMVVYAEMMQSDQYDMPTLPVLEDAKTLYDWVLEGRTEPGTLQVLASSALVVIQGVSPLITGNRCSSAHSQDPPPPATSNQLVHS
jgi:hypothetical protein